LGRGLSGMPGISKTCSLCPARMATRMTSGLLIRSTRVLPRPRADTCAARWRANHAVECRAPCRPRRVEVDNVLRSLSRDRALGVRATSAWRRGVRQPCRCRNFSRCRSARRLRHVTCRGGRVDVAAVELMCEAGSGPPRFRGRDERRSVSPPRPSRQLDEACRPCPLGR